MSQPFALQHPEPDVHMKGDELGRSYTPDPVALAVVERLRVRVELTGVPVDVLEPCVGGGAFVRASRACFCDPIVVGADIDPEAPGLTICDSWLVRDFSHAMPAQRVYSLAITNPPYGKVVGQDTTIRIVQAARKAAAVTCMVMPLAYLAQDGWSDLVDECAEVWPLLPRPFEHDREQAAYVWDRRHVGDTRVRSLRWKAC